MINYSLIHGKAIAPVIENSIRDFAVSTTGKEMKRARDIKRDKIYAVSQFFNLIGKAPNEITISDVNEWHQWMLDQGKQVRITKDGSKKPIKGLEDSTIYVRISYLSSYYEWLMKIPQFAEHIKFNPARSALPKAPKKYSSAKSKSLTDEDYFQLWNYVRNAAENLEDKAAVRDYAILTLFSATGLRREEVLGLSAGDIRLTSKGILIHAHLKGGDYKWKTVADAEAIAALDMYLSVTKRRSTIGDKKRALWIRFDRGALSALYDKDGVKKEIEPRLSSHSFDKRIKQYAHNAGIGHIHIHQFRHTFARMVSEELGILEAQDALEHANIQTTREYVKNIEFKKDKYSSIIANRRHNLAEEKRNEKISNNENSL